MRAIVHVNVTGAEHVPSTGGAVLVVNRGFGIFEPAAVAVAVQRAAGRRTRAIGAPTAPIVSGLFRRLGAISGAGRDPSTRARPVIVAVPLAPTWLRTGAGHTAAPAHAGDDPRAGDPRRGHTRWTARHRDPPVARALRPCRSRSTRTTIPVTRSARPGSRKRCATR